MRRYFCPEHPGATVWLDGTYPVRTGRRQRYKCIPADGSPPHRLSRPIGETGEREPLHFRYSTRTIAEALVAVGRGDSYRQAAARARGEAEGAGGNLVADWVELFAPLLVAALQPSRWPPNAFVGMRPLRVGGRQHERALFEVQAILAGGSRGAPALVLAAAPLGERQAWRRLAGRLAGAPERLLLAEGSLPKAALPSRWPAPGSPRGGQARQATELRRALDRAEALLAPRAGNLRNRERLNRLLGLVSLDLVGAASVDRYAQVLEQTLEQTGGQPPPRHLILDRRGESSLQAPRRKVRS